MEKQTGTNREREKLQQDLVRIRTYAIDKVNFLGTKNVNVSYKGVTVNETIYIAEGNGPNQLGRDWLQQLVVLKLNQVSTLLEFQSLIRNYEEVFSEPQTSKVFRGEGVRVMIQKIQADEGGCDLLPQIASDFFNSLEYQCNDLHMESDLAPVDKALIHIAVDVQQANMNTQDPFSELWLNSMLSKPGEMCRTTIKLQPSEDFYDTYTNEAETEKSVVEQIRKHLESIVQGTSAGQRFDFDQDQDV
ncbi:hypothetical protein CLF_101730 [Clonorchis sinensis]|uniref:Uncharacterized protein n=1 Tax=Clonorchis sinensis TaxID=79923 RepID=G7Y6F6_CLOSI|nr:hypothetical protein CLF_101730 [Clonorchis sinensis]